jgi:hypothetical protein
MEVTELPPTPFVRPTAGDLVHLRTRGADTCYSHADVRKLIMVYG